MKKFKDNIKLVDNIPDWPGYHVTPEGEVWSRHKMVRYSFVLGDKWYLMNVRLKGRKGINRFNENTGRPFVNLSRYEDGHYIQKKVLVHRLVAFSVGCISSVIKNPNCIKLYEKKYQ